MNRNMYARKGQDLLMSVARVYKGQDLHSDDMDN